MRQICRIFLLCILALQCSGCAIESIDLYRLGPARGYYQECNSYEGICRGSSFPIDVTVPL